MRIFILLLGLAIASTSLAKIYSWKDANGKVVYGDNPPEHNKAKEVETQELTIVPGYSETPAAVPEDSSQEKKEEEESPGYESFTVSYPAADEAIRANDGNLTASFALSPGLKASDQVFIYLDGKKVNEGGKALTASFTNLDRGSHSIFAVVRNDNGDVLINSDTVTFHVLRNSIILNPRIN